MDEQVKETVPNKPEPQSQQSETPRGDYGQQMREKLDERLRQRQDQQQQQQQQKQ